MGAIKDGTSNTIFASERCVAQGGGQEDRGGRSGLVNNFNNGGNTATPQDCMVYRGANNEIDLTNATTFPVTYQNDAGFHWSDARGRWGGFFHATLPPNSISCKDNADERGGFISASSFHMGGVNVSMCDGSVKFVTDSIDAGNPADLLGQINGVWQPGVTTNVRNNPHQWTGPSSYGIWGAAGTIAGGESTALP
jgi:prepilin-type processing-associated H-X9-DG protein